MTLQELSMALYVRPQNLPLVIDGSTDSIGNPHLYKCNPEIIAFERVQILRTVGEVLLSVQRLIDAELESLSGVKYLTTRLSELRISKMGQCDGIIPVRLETHNDIVLIKIIKGKD